MLPVLYTTVALTSSNQILAFSYSLQHSVDLEIGETLGSYVRYLWVGPISSISEHDLSYASSAWPVTIIHQILRRCPSLRALAIVNLAQHLLYRLEGIIPASVQSIHLGPVHGHLDLPKLRCEKQLQTITSMDTYLSDWEVHQIVTAPHVKCFRRFYSNPARISFAFDQLPCVKEAKSLERLEILCCADTVEVATLALREHASEYSGRADERIWLVATSSCFSTRADGIRALYHDWINELGKLVSESEEPINIGDRSMMLETVSAPLEKVRNLPLQDI
ncbi:uncharacterized protein FIBRA_01596 [Fibroporia radiculosa]|uniref:F-box domain-containing protein n=1 Tax=Fibroporia radiculosa TaxID=599839 RepID=J4G128_9APHY|nr:uncharacterized protein FIBRA_01596 [Fibroporia radiculosa]CCL99578.1 predicted protein [Fibroporia radiculosa]